MKVRLFSSLIMPAFLFPMIFFGCGPDDPVIITFEDIEREFQAIDLTSGIQDVEIEVDNGYFWRFRVIPPTNPTSGTYPLIMDFHGASGGSELAHTNTGCYTEPGLQSLDAFIIAPNAGTEEWYHESNQDKVFHLVRMAIAYWQVDASKLAVIGYSNGGNATWFYSEYQSNTFSAGIAMASSYDTSLDATNGRKINTPLYVIHSDGDELFPIATTEEWVNKSIDAGSDITWVVATGLSHYEPCDYVPYLQEAVTWLTDVVWQ